MFNRKIFYYEVIENKNLLYGILVALILVGGVFLLTVLNRAKDTEEISSFEECAKAGYPILESYPRQCKTPDRRTFTEELTSKLSPAPATSQGDVGEYCDADNPCPEGEECYKFQDEDKPICWSSDPCEKCESKNCRIGLSYPAQVICQ